jgi:hypothetical protein
VFARELAGDAVIVAVNRGAQAAGAEVPLPAGWNAAREVLGGTPVEVRDGALSLRVPPRTAQVVAAEIP